MTVEVSHPKTLKFGRYKNIILLANTRHANVYQAFDTETEEKVAIKVLSITGQDREFARSLFNREIQALQGVTHPAIIKLLDHFTETEKDLLCIVLELIPNGENLESFIKTHQLQPRKLSLMWRVQQLISLLGAIEYAHQRQVIHRDIKLANILVHKEADIQTLRLADFGIARLLFSETGQSAGQTVRSHYSLPFAAPEQVKRHESSYASDYYSFGLLAACLLTWQVPSIGFTLANFDEFLLPLKKELEDDSLYQPIYTAIKTSLSDSPRERTQPARFQVALEKLLHSKIEHTQVKIEIIVSARADLLNSFPNLSKAIQDLNEELVGKYELAGSEDFVIHLYGKTFQAIAKRNEDGNLVITKVKQSPPSSHRDSRKKASPIPFELVMNSGNTADDLVGELYRIFKADEKQRVGKEAKEKFLKIPKIILELQDKGSPKYHLHYEVSLSESPKSSESSRGTPRVFSCTKGETIELEIFNIVSADTQPKNISVETPESDESIEEVSVFDIWLETASKETAFTRVGDKTAFAHFYSFDVQTKILKISIDKPFKLPESGQLESVDIQLKAALDRQNKAFLRFMKDDAENPRLSNLILSPDLNKIGEQKDINLIQHEGIENPEQMRQLISCALAAEDFYLIQGPPGTGKTTVITELIAQILDRDPSSRILLTSQANEAVNNALDRLQKVNEKQQADWRTLRDVRSDKIGGEGISEFDQQFDEWITKTIEQSQSAELQLDVSSRENGLTIASMLRNWRERLPRTVDVRRDYAESVQVFGVTCMRVPALWKLLQKKVEFDWVIVDEAAKATHGEILVTLVTGRKFILVGDQRQLPPHLDREIEKLLKEQKIDPDVVKYSLFEYLFEKISKTNKITLRRQYRMHKSIGDFVGNLFYGDIGGLETGIADEQRSLCLARFNEHKGRIFWLDTHGKEIAQKTSFYNMDEIHIIENLLNQFNKDLSREDEKYTVGVITPYLAQVEKIEREIRPYVKQWRNLSVKVATVDAFQGKETDIILFSTVRTQNGKMRFGSDKQRLNVAFSRAKRLLLIIGDHEVAKSDTRMKQVLDAIPNGQIVKRKA